VWVAGWCAAPCRCDAPGHRAREVGQAGEHGARKIEHAHADTHGDTPRSTHAWAMGRRSGIAGGFFPRGPLLLCSQPPVCPELGPLEWQERLDPPRQPPRSRQSPARTWWRMSVPKNDAGSTKPWALGEGKGRRAGNQVWEVPTRVSTPHGHLRNVEWPHHSLS
jgi:hypothetical protein